MSHTNQIGRWAALTPQLYRIENLVFKEQTVNLDGYYFKNCAFVSCVLTTSAGNFVLDECFFGGEWGVRFGGMAPNIVKLTRILDWSEPSVELMPVVSHSGGVTIK
jgi:hypothetical protein